MIRSNNLLRSWLLTGMLASLMMFAASNMVRSQDILPCKCDVITVNVGKVPCKFEVCVKDAAGFECAIVGPGSVQQFKCHDQAAVFLKDCQGNLVQINNDKNNCVYCVCVGFEKGCCAVDACVEYDKNGCITVNITPSPCRILCP